VSSKIGSSSSLGRAEAEAVLVEVRDFDEVAFGWKAETPRALMMRLVFSMNSSSSAWVERNPDSA